MKLKACKLKINPSHISLIADELGLKETQVNSVALMIAQDATVPFIARYRKEATGSLDEVAVTAIRERLKQLDELDKRRESVIKSLEQHGHLTEDLKKEVLAAETLASLEDIYLPFKPKRRTKAAIAKEKGLEPLALMIFKQAGNDPFVEAMAYVDAEKGVNTPDEAVAGARNIIAEIINENEQARSKLRFLFSKKGMINSKVISGRESDGIKYRDYFEWEEPVAAAPSHRILAIRRGEKEEVLNLSIAPDEEAALQILYELFIKGDSEDSNQVKIAVSDCYKRLLSRSMETEIRVDTKEKADYEAIKIFAENLRQLLMEPPLGSKRVMGVDPGLRTGCKLVCLDRQGKLLAHDTIFPHTSGKTILESEKKVKKLCMDYKIEAVAVGNGTAGRETESFFQKLDFLKDVPIIMVSESGASIYSASEIAREEFPDLDITVRGAVSIGRRLMDPMAELVKLNPKSIGVGQYQHDVDQSALKESLDDVVMSCVNRVGVDVNRASSQLLAYVSGLGPKLARNITEYRNKNGPFQSRAELKKVQRLGAKAFEQSAGFLRIFNSENPLDYSAVHPESYHIVYKMAENLGCSINDMIKKSEMRKKIAVAEYVTDNIGIPTLNDIMDELAKPGRDPRKKFEAFSFANGIEKIEDLRSGMKVPGIVTNLTGFGAFVDIGVHQDGLLHVSKISDRYIKNPADVLKVHQHVIVTVLNIDLERKRISLSMQDKTAVGSGDVH